MYVLHALSYLEISYTYSTYQVRPNNQFISPAHVQIMHNNKIKFEKDRTRSVYCARSAHARSLKFGNDAAYTCRLYTRGVVGQNSPRVYLGFRYMKIFKIGHNVCTTCIILSRNSLRIQYLLSTTTLSIYESRTCADLAQ